MNMLIGVLLKLVIIAFVWLLSVTSAHANSPQQIAAKAFRSTVILVMQDGNGQAISLGSGFFVRDGEIATNYHVIRGASRGYARLIGQKHQLPIEGFTAIDERRDLVLLKVPSGRWPTLEIGNSDSVQVGESIYAVGNPQGLEGTFSQGIVSGIRSSQDGSLIQITAPISPGSSGGPVLNQSGSVIGVAVSTFKSGQNLNFAIASSHLRALANTSGSARSLSSITSPTPPVSIVSDLGGRASDGVVGLSLEWTHPACSNCGGYYTLSIKNQLDRPIKNVLGNVIFFDDKAQPIEVDTIRFTGVIPAGLARRTGSRVDQSVQSLNYRYNILNGTENRNKIEIRILDFQFAD
jgi:S1-C subfamily serine protease